MERGERGGRRKKWRKWDGEKVKGGGFKRVGWLVVLRLNVPVSNFSVMSGRSHRFLGN